MILKFLLIKLSDPSFSQELDFNKFPIFLGREDKNDVILPDPFKVISRKHAKIIETEGILQLVDLESQNFTYLNGTRLTPNEENALATNDKIKIGDYEMEIQFFKEKEAIPDDDQKTMVFSSPFAENVANLVESMRIISDKYSFDNSPMKADMLKFSLLQSLHDLGKTDANKILAEYFAENFLDKEIHKPKQEVVSSPPDKGKGAAYTSSAKVPLTSDYSFSSHFSNTTDILLDAFSKLIQGFLQFRQEFFGVTIYYTIPTGSLKELKEFLFDPQISHEDEKKRLSLLKEEVQKLLTHQIGLLEGYHASVTEGSKLLLQSLDPDAIEKEMQIKNQQSSGIDIGKILPFTQKSKLLDFIKENYRKYISDPYHIEKKFFRPSFMKGYQKRILSKSQNEY